MRFLGRHWRLILTLGPPGIATAAALLTGAGSPGAAILLGVTWAAILAMVLHIPVRSWWKYGLAILPMALASAFLDQPAGVAGADAFEAAVGLCGEALAGLVTIAVGAIAGGLCLLAVSPGREHSFQRVRHALRAAGRALKAPAARVRRAAYRFALSSDGGPETTLHVLRGAWSGAFTPAC